MRYYQSELDDPSTQYFILDTGRKGHRDVDFEKYTWDRKRFNLVKEGDLFIYRTPQKVSHSGKFYFFGSGKVEKISEVDSSSSDVYATVSKGVQFDNWIYQDDIRPIDLSDPRKDSNENWERFFSNYGMNRKSKNDFLFLLEKGISNSDIFDEHENLSKIHAHKNNFRRLFR